MPHVPSAQKSFWTHPFVLRSDEAQVKARFSSIEIVLILTQDRCMVCVEHTIGSDIVLDAPDGTPRRRGSCGISFQSDWRQCSFRCKIGARFAPNVP